LLDYLKNFIFILGIICIIAGALGLCYTYQIDHRTADSLSAYCRIDFQSSRDEKNRLEGAVLSLWDYRYDSAYPEAKAVLYTDGIAWEMQGTVKQTSPKEHGEEEHQFQNENKFFFLLPRHSLSAIQKAEEVRLRFYYDNGQTIDLPLNEPDLKFWQEQLN